MPVGKADYSTVRNQVRQLEGQRTSRSFEIIVADNSGSWTRQDWQASAARTRVLKAARQRGAGFARNMAAEVARGEFLLFCDADDLVGPDWLEHHLRALEVSDFTCGSSLLVDNDSPLLSAALAGFWPAEAPRSRGIHHEGKRVASGNNMGIRVRLFWSVGGFPANYLRSQDIAISLALEHIDVEPAFVPEALVLKVRKRRSFRQAWAVNFESGRSRVRLRRDFRSGPTPAKMVVRSFVRTARAAGRRRQWPERTVVELVQLWGVLVEITRTTCGQAPSTTVSGGQTPPLSLPRQEHGPFTRHTSGLPSPPGIAYRLTGLLLRTGIACRDARRSSVLVYSDTKVGSTTVERWIPAATTRRVVKLHHLRGPQLRRLGPLLIRTLWEGKPSPTSWNGQVMRARLVLDPHSSPWQVVTLVRDPVARAVSHYFYFAEPSRQPFLFGDPDKVDLGALTARAVPELMALVSRDWFVNEFQPVTGIDVYANPFATDEGGNRYRNGRFDVLLLRCEDLATTAARELARFLSTRNPPPFGRERAGARGQVSSIYQRFRAEAQLPEALLDHAYSQRYAQHFYKTPEIAEFRHRWSAKPSTTP